METKYVPESTSTSYMWKGPSEVKVSYEGATACVYRFLFVDSLSTSKHSTDDYKASASVTIEKATSSNVGQTSTGSVKITSVATGRTVASDSRSWTCVKKTSTTDAYYLYRFLLTYDADGGSGALSTQYSDWSKTQDAVTWTLSSTIPSRDGCEFLGWSTSRGGDVQYQPGASVSGKDIALYAVWKQTYVSPPFRVRTGDGWRYAAVSVKVDGTYRSAEAYVKVDGVWVKKES